MLGTILDSVIGAISPTAALKRVQARRLIRAYAGAEPSRLNANKKPKNNSADAELGGQFGANQLRAWARMLVRDNAWAWGVVDTFVNSVVGKGIDIQSALETPTGEDIEAINEQRDQTWQEWAEVCELNGQYTFAEIQQMAMREIVEAGEVLIRMVTVDRKFGGVLRPVPLALELIEADRLAEDKDTRIFARSGARINRGIELDELGKPVAYWIYPNHPTDPYTLRGEPVRIEADEIIHLFNRQRVGQTRGISMFAPVIPWIRDLGLYVENEMQASAVASCFTVAIKTENGSSQSLFPPSAESTSTHDSDGNRYQYLQPGLIMNLAPNESIESANPGRPNSASEPWIKLMLRGIAVGTGLSYETVGRDYSQTNYSSNRASQLEDRRRFRRWQQYLITRLNQRVWDRFVMAASMVDLPAFPLLSDILANPRKAAPCEHMPPSWEWVDPQSEQQSSEAGIKAFQTTYLDELAGRGKNWRQVFYQRAKEESLLKQLGLTSPAAIEAGAVAEPATTGADGAAPAVNVAATALNGAQVTSLVEILSQVAAGAMPKDSAKAVIAASFPTLPQQLVAAIIDPILPGSVSADGEPQAPQAPGQAAGSGEMMGLSRLQWQRNRKAIMDVLKDVMAGAISQAQATVLLSGLGLSGDNVTLLLQDAADGTVDSVPAEGTAPAAPAVEGAAQ